jgi:hypothetical protein
MRWPMVLPVVIAGMAYAGIGLTTALGEGAPPSTGAVEQNVPPPVSQEPSVAPLQLSDEQRTKIKQALSSEHTEVSFALKSAKGAQNFEPSPGATVPKGLKLHPLPRPLVYDIPVLKRYTYLKFKQEVLIVNPMTHKIVDMFPET